MTEIGYSAFEGCGLRALRIPSSVTEMGPFAFAGCLSLEARRVRKCRLLRQGFVQVFFFQCFGLLFEAWD